MCICGCRFRGKRSVNVGQNVVSNQSSLVVVVVVVIVVIIICRRVARHLRRRRSHLLDRVLGGRRQPAAARRAAGGRRSRPHAVDDADAAPRRGPGRRSGRRLPPSRVQLGADDGRLSAVAGRGRSHAAVRRHRVRTGAARVVCSAGRQL